MQKFYEVHFSEGKLQEGLTGKDAREVTDRLHSFALPLYGALNGARKGPKGFLRRGSYAFGEYRGIMINLSEAEDSSQKTEVLKHGEFGIWLHSPCRLHVQDLLALPQDDALVGPFVMGIYDRGLNNVRGKYGVPDDFLLDFIKNFESQQYTSTFEHGRYTFPDHRLIATYMSRCSPTQEKHYLRVRRMRTKEETSVHIGTIDRPSGTQMHHAPVFDGEVFLLKSWLKQPYWPVSFCREKIHLSELSFSSKGN